MAQIKLRIPKPPRLRRLRVQGSVLPLSPGCAAHNDAMPPLRRLSPPLCLFSFSINLPPAGAAGPRAAIQVPRVLLGSAWMSACLHWPHTTTKAGTTLMQLQAKRPRSLLSSSATTSFFIAYFYSDSCKVTSHQG